VLDEGDRVGFSETYEGAQKIKAKHEKEGTAMPSMTFGIEGHNQKVRDNKTGKSVFKQGFLLRSNDGKFSKFSEDRTELQNIVLKAQGKDPIKVKKAKATK